METPVRSLQDIMLMNTKSHTSLVVNDLYRTGLFRVYLST